MNFRENTAVIIPIWNEEKVIRGVLEKVLEKFDFVVAVNDGSKDETEKEIKKTKAVCLSHEVNVGQGGGLETGIRYALKNPSIKYFVTFDADGQHNLDDAEKMLNAIEKSDADIILGSRFLEKGTEVPPLKKVILKAGLFFSKMTTGLDITDSHNGLRVFNRKFAETIDLKNFDYAHASEFLDIIAINKFKYKEHPVTITYSEYSKGKGQSMLNLVNIGFDVLLNRKK